MRNSNIELLRIFSMVMIIMLHLIQNDIRFHTLLSTNSINNFSIISLKLFSNAGVSLFALITGYFGLKFSTQKLFNLIFKTWLYSLTIVLIFYFLGNLEFKDVVRHLIPLNSGHWYISAYVILLLLTPFWSDKIDTLPLKKHLNWLIISGIILYVFFWLSFDIGTNATLIIYLYFLGRFIYKMKALRNTDVKKTLWGGDNCSYAISIYNICYSNHEQ